MVFILNVKDMDEVGLGKVRFVGVWVIGRVFKKVKKYVRNNFYILCKDIRV